MRKIILSVSVMAARLVALWGFSRCTERQAFGELVSRVDTTEKVVALTFDDGPSRRNTDRILQILEAHQVAATFYLVGKAMEANPTETVKIRSAGHDIGNHSYSHTRMVMKSMDFVSDELERTNELIRYSGYNGPIHFRPPYGKKLFVLPYYLNQAKIRSITWDVAPEDDLDASASPSEIASYVIESVTPGSIVLLHVMYRSRENSLISVPLIINGLRDRGFKFVTISELLRLERA